jgi:NADPH:quinone reductase-like Zn-dependent oxidoreductase
MARKGLYPDAPKPPCVVGYEVSGIIEAAGQGIESSMVGKSVLALTRFNGYSEKVCVSSENVFTIPKFLDFEKAAAIPVNYLTAYQLLCVMGGLKKGESVLIHNAGGGVGLAALDIALHLEATTCGTSSAKKHAFLKERGLSHPIDYRNQDFLSAIMHLTDGIGHLWHERDKISGWMQNILNGVEEGWVRPHVDRTFPFDQAGEAHAYIEARKNIGKIVLVTGN